MNAYLFYSAMKYRRKYNITIDKKYIMISIATLFVGAMDIVFPIIGRVNMYLTPLFVIGFSLVVKNIPYNYIKNKLIMRVFFIYMTWFIVYNALKPEWFHLYPYSFMDIGSVYNGYDVYDYQ